MSHLVWQDLLLRIATLYSASLRCGKSEQLWRSATLIFALLNLTNVMTMILCRSEVVRPAMQGTLLAPSLVQRQAYGRSLHIYGKLNIKVPLRLASLADDYEVRLAYDALFFIDPSLYLLVFKISVSLFGF